MARTHKRRFSTINENWSENISLAEAENKDLNCQKKVKNSIVASVKEEKKELFKDLMVTLNKLVPNVFKKDKPSAAIVCKLIEDLVQMEDLIEKNNDYENNVDYIIQAQKIDNQLKYIVTINSGGLLDIIGQTVVEKYFNQSSSYYEQNFNEIKLLGSGAFGKVYTAIHKIDKVQYAIKKIKIKSHKKKEIQHSLKEVKTLAKLHHPNIIAYKNAWIELEPIKENEFPSSSQLSESSQSSSDGSSLNNVNNNMKVCKLNCSQEHTSDNESSQDSLYIETGQIFTLYIQMALSTMNLRTWLDSRSGLSDEIIIKNIAKQVLRGLNYIHQLKIVHHDINPNNILITSKPNDLDEVQIGDFGLARYLLKKNQSEIGGTELYCAPEQLENKCDSKSDIFSFGIVLFELLFPMQTDFERIIEIGNFKKGNELPPSITNNYPDWDEILSKSIHKDPEMRASAEDLLNMINKKEFLMGEKFIRRKTVSCCRRIQYLKQDE